MATGGGGGTTKLGLDAAEYIAGMQQVLKWTAAYSVGMKAAAVASLEFNDTGEQIGAVVHFLANSGDKIIATLEKTTTGYKVAAGEIKKSLNDVLAEEKRVARERAQIKADKNLTAFRTTTGKTIQSSLFPKGGKNTDYRTLFGDLDQVEGYIRRGELTAKRAQKILGDIAGGSSKRITSNGFAERFRQDALKLYADAERLRQKLASGAAKATAKLNAPKVAPALEGAFGKINASATEGQLGRVGSAFLRIQGIVANTGVAFGRFEELVRRHLGGATAAGVDLGISFTKALGDAKRVTILADVAKLDKELAKDKGFYVGPGGTGAAIAGRYPGFEKFLAGARTSGTPIEQPRATIGPRGEPSIENGRHRLAVLRDQGVTQVPISVDKASADAFRRQFGVLAEAATVAEKQVAQSLQKISKEYRSAADEAVKAAEKVRRQKDALAIGDALRSSKAPGFGYANASSRSQDRADSAIAKIQNQVIGGKLTQAQFDNVFDAVVKGAKKNFTGAEEVARQSLVRIRGIISGELHDAFASVDEPLRRSLTALKAVFAANFALELLEKFKSLVDEAAEFQRSIALIQTITQDANLSFGQWADGIRQVSDELGKPIGEIAAAGYDLLSNQVTKAADTFDVLRVAGQFARVTNSNTADSVNLLSSAINTFGLGAADADRVAAQFFTTIDLGRVKAADLANTAGRVFETGRTVGASLEDVNAALITITQTGIRADTAQTLIQNIFQKLLNPTKELQALYDKLGVSTGENFVKTYGFAGALRKLEEATKGSSAKLATFFNEIRAFQGIDNLISRIKVFEDALQQLDKSVERQDAAKKLFNNLPGQQYVEQINKVQNLLLVGGKTEILNAVLGITHAFGDLDKVVVTLVEGSTALATGFTAWFGIMKFQTVIAGMEEMYQKQLLSNAALTRSQFLYGELEAKVAAGGLATGFILGLSALALFAAKLVEIKDFYDTLHDKIENDLNEQSKKSQQDDEKTRTKEVADNEKALNKKKQDLLKYAADAKEILSLKGSNLDTVGESLGEGLKNSLELVLKSAKGALQGITNAQEAALKSIRDIKKERAGLRDGRDGSLFNFAKTRDEVLTGGANEKQIYQNRIDQLTRFQRRAVKSGDKEGLDKAFQEKRALLEELANKTVNVDGVDYLKYTGQEQALLDLYKEEDRYLAKIAARKQEEVRVNEKIILTMSQQVKEAEDAAKALYGFSLTDKHTGKLIDSSKEEAEARLKKLEDNYNRTQAAISGNSHFNRGNYREADTATAAQLQADRERKAREDIARFHGNRVERAGINDQERNVDTARDAEVKAIEELIASIRQLSKDISASSTELYQAENKALALSGSMLANANELADRSYIINRRTGGTDDAAKAEETRTGLIGQYNKHLEGSNYDQADAVLKKLEYLYHTYGIQNHTYAGGPNGEEIGYGEGVKRLRAQTNTARDANRVDTANRVAYGQAQAVPGKSLDDAKIFLDKYRNVAGSATIPEAAKQGALNGLDFITELVTKAKAVAEQIAARNASLQGLNPRREAAPESSNNTPPAGQYMGGDVGYFAGGGSVADFMAGKFARGIDTVPIMANRDEFIMNPQSSRRFHSQLVAMNSGFDPGHGGAHGSTTTVGDIHVNVQGGGTSQATIKEIAAGIQREIRRGTIQLRG